jgi:hypothetical protein
MGMRLELHLDTETSLALQRAAYQELRTMPAHALALLRSALGLPMTYPPVIDVKADEDRPAWVGREP